MATQNELPLPRLATKLPRYEGGIKPTRTIRTYARGKRGVELKGGQQLRRIEAGGPVAEWEVAGLPGTHRDRGAAMRARAKA
jgi:hypothetical protein